jgi:MoxR-like ATPase
MRAGGFLYIEEFNRAPEDTINTLLTAMAERQVAVPTAGIVTAAPTFRVVASMNPYDNVGTTRLSTSVHDRICRLAIGYQDAAAERGIVALRAPLPSVAPELYQRLVADAVAVTRATREHPDICEARGNTPSWCTTRWWSRCPAGSSWTRPSRRRRRRCSGRSGRTSSSWPRPRRRLVEEQ